MTSQATLSIVIWGGAALAPELAREHGLSAAGIGAVLSASSVGSALTQVLAGGLVDRFGARWALIGGAAGSGVLLGLGGFAPDAVTLSLVLVAAGAVSSLVALSGATSVFHAFPPARRGLALGVRQASVSAGGLIAAFLLPATAAHGGVRLALGTSGALAALGGIAFGLATPGGPASPRVGRKAIAPGEVLRAGQMPLLLVLASFQIAVLTAVLTFAVSAEEHAGWSSLELSLLFATISLSAMASRIVWGRVADRDGGRRRRATLRDISAVACAGALIYWLIEPAGAAYAIPAMLPFAFGALGFNGVLYVVAGEIAGSDRAGQAVGWVATVLFGGSALLAVPLGALADHAGYRALWPASAVLAALASALAHRLARSHGRTA